MSRPVLALPHNAHGQCGLLPQATGPAHYLCSVTISCRRFQARRCGAEICQAVSVHACRLHLYASGRFIRCNSCCFLQQLDLHRPTWECTGAQLSSEQSPAVLTRRGYHVLCTHFLTLLLVPVAFTSLVSHAARTSVNRHMPCMPEVTSQWYRGSHESARWSPVLTTRSRLRTFSWSCSTWRRADS